MRHPSGPGLWAATFWLWTGATCLVMATPYIGIDNDARLYMVGALHFLNPDHYARDIWFFEGSQDRWSVFSPVLAQFVGLFDIDGGAKAATLFQGALFLVSAYWFSRATLRRPASLLLFLLLLGYPICYSPKGMLFVREGFVSARMVGIGFSLFGLALCLQGRTAVGALCHALALAVHPIMAVGPAAVSVLMRSGLRGQMVLSLVGCLAFGGLFGAAACGWLAVMEADWWAYVDLAALVSIGDWIGSSIYSWLSLFALLLVAGRYGNARLRSFYQLVALVAVVSVLASVLAGLYLQVVILLQAQLWRTLWLAHVAALVATVDLGFRYVLRRHAPYRELGALLGAIALVFPALIGALLVALVAVYRHAPNRLSALSRILQNHPVPVAFVSAALAVIALPGYVIDWSMETGSLDIPAPVSDTLFGFLRTGGYGLVALGVWLMGRSVIARPMQARTTILIPLTLIAMLVWDARTAEKRAQEERYSLSGDSSRFAGIIPQGSVVYWARAAERVWFELGTAGYAGALHSTGMVFSRGRTRALSVRLVGVALASADRAKLDDAIASGSVLEAVLRRGNSVQESVDPFLLAAYESLSAMTPFGLRNLCRDRQLDYVVDTLYVPEVTAIPVQDEILGRRQQYFVYSCDAFHARRR